MDRKQSAHRSGELIECCTLAAGAQGACRWCGGELPKRRRTWCSDRCADRFWKNHWWTLARRAVKRRDKYRCKRCGHKPPSRSHPHYKRLRRTDRLEVNHIEPARGAHGSLSCLHHLDNLEALCLGCHRAVTGAQRALLV